MAISNFLINVKSLFNIELAKRILSVIFFVPIFIFSLSQGGVLLLLLFILFYLIILSELINLFKLSYSKISVIIYSFIASFCIILFPYYYFTLDNNFIICLYIIISLWIFDTFSFLGGNIFRGKKIFPKLSKGKTYSGLISGITAVIIFNFFISHYIYIILIFNLFFLAIFICLLSFIGDAYVSLLKRQSELKDTGNLFIGHGGFLDRMDSFIFVFFFFIIFDIEKIFYYA